MPRAASHGKLYPIYMVLGSPKWIQKMGDPATLATTAEIRIPLSILAADDVSFTYPDSMVTLMLAAERNPAHFQPDCHGKLFTLAEMRALVATKGMPDEGWETSVPVTLAHYIEAQVWNRTVLVEYLAQNPM